MNKDVPPAAIRAAREAWLELLRDEHPGLSWRLIEPGEAKIPGEVVVSLIGDVPKEYR